MAAVTFTGIGSGFDANSIIDALVRAEKIPANQLLAQQAATQTQLSALGDITSKLNAIRTQANNLALPSAVSPLVATSTQSNVAASAMPTALAGIYEVNVTQLARAQTSLSQSYATDSAGVLGAGSVTISSGTTSGAITWTASDSISDVAARINTTVGAAVSAAAVKTASGFQLMIYGKNTGAANAVTFSNESGDSLALTTPQAAQDAAFTVNGVNFTRTTNRVTDAVQGLTLDFSAVSTQPSRVTVSQDRSAIANGVQALVNAYNTVQRALNAQLTFNGTRKTSDTLFGDPVLTGLQRSLGGAVSGLAVGSLTTRGMGIKTGEDGQLSLDTSVLNAQLDKDPSSLQTFLNSTNGLAKSLAAVVQTYTDPQSGLLTSAQTSRQAKIKRFETEINRINDAADSQGESLRQRFAKLDTLMNNFKSQQSALAGIFKTPTSS